MQLHYRSDHLSLVSPPVLFAFTLETWQSYIEWLQSGGHVASAAIYDFKGNLKARSTHESGPAVSREECYKLLSEFSRLHELDKHGIKLEGTEYTVRIADGKNGILFENYALHKGGTICKTVTHFIIAMHDETMAADRCNHDAMLLGDALLRKGL